MYGFTFEIGDRHESAYYHIGDCDIIIACDKEEYEKLVAWLFENTKKRFVFLG